jgi:hypothetical protein
MKDMDGSLYTKGQLLMIHPKINIRTGGASMGGFIAECQDEATAEELADAYNLKHQIGPHTPK